MRSWYDLRLIERASIPPPDLIERVAGTRHGRAFLSEGYKLFGEFREAVERHGDLASARLLDWGCGCGRVLAHWQGDAGVSELFGCDIDPEAIAWCQGHLPLARCAVIPAWPPTGYGDQAFDVVTSCSVLTHLDRHAQALWLAEMGRILRPGGLLVASVHGPSAALFAFPPARPRDSLWSRLGARRPRLRPAIDLDASGIFDGMDDHALDDVAPAGYYRSTFQSESYTRRSWTPWFDVVEYSVRGIGNNQDLVVGRRRRAA
jgi:SAM-dependent methyltransferase